MLCSYKGNISQCDIQDIVDREEFRANPVTSNMLTNFEDCVFKMNELKELKKQLSFLEKESSKENEMLKIAAKITRLERQIAILKQKSDIPFEETDVLISATEKKRCNFIFKLNAQNTERLFLCSLVKKYPSGQAVSNRVLKNIKRVVNLMKKIIAQYNEMKSIPSLKSPDSLSSEQVFKQTSDIWSSCQPPQMTSNHKMVQSYLMVQRANEEIDMVKRDMSSCLAYYQSLVTILEEKQKIPNYKHLVPYLRCQQWRMELDLKKTLP
uniref:uncharacterized protein LOC108950610 isoform X1 n=1 Tax=Ciona intestinalis TaxID=7719 RepID=UPI000EF4E929|nr:uncharacterized protein LOC108950610 isoform X1 [Ciona intestinalis]XP_026695354.1 uncharacterized protein LOC108950610 isoform X1 [Ciona intestinalis]|eukprot:XP_026695353.1 uncharacterized protein LOC108950610 isoform X1 [Ciona intestinalis]